MDHQTLGRWDNRPNDPAYYIEDCRIYGGTFEPHYFQIFKSLITEFELSGLGWQGSQKNDYIGSRNLYDSSIDIQPGWNKVEKKTTKICKKHTYFHNFFNFVQICLNNNQRDKNALILQFQISRVFLNFLRPFLSLRLDESKKWNERNFAQKCQSVIAAFRKNGLLSR